MDKTNQTRTGDGSKGICERIRRSLAVSPGEPPFNRVRYVQQDPTPASTALLFSSPSRTNVSDSKQRGNGVVPIDFHRSAFAKHNKGHIITVEGVMEAEAEAAQGRGGDQFQPEPENKMNDKFSQFIHRAKQRITRTTSSNVGAGGIARLDSVNKKASAYIEGARQRIRNSATLQAGTK